MRDRDVAAFELAATVLVLCIVVALSLVLFFAVDGVLHHFGWWGR